MIVLLLLIVLSQTPLTEPPSVGVAEVGPTVAAHPVIPPSGRVSGTATWYCGTRSACTRGYRPSDLVAAIDPSLGIARGARLRVIHGGRSVTVRVVDVCACAGRRVIDLTSGAFRRLAPLSRGVIPVTIETGPAPTLPPTDTAP